MSRSNRFLILVPVVLSLCLAAPAYAGDALQGPSFSDPSQTFSMPREWIERPIRHEKWAGKADIAVTLEQDVYQMILPLIERFAKERGIKIAVKKGTCGMAAGMLSRKAIDIGGFCCPPSREDRLPGLKFHTLGIVSIAFLVNPANPVESISAKKLRMIFRGQFYKWSQLTAADGRPGPPLEIKPVGRLHCPLRPGHWRLLLDNSDLFSPRLQEVGSIPDMIARVARNRGAIGWETLGMAEYYRNYGMVKPIRVGGLSPADTSAIATGMYPFYRVYNLTTWDGRNVENRDARALVTYLTKVLEDRGPSGLGFVPASMLRKAGWKFRGDELIGGPGGKR